MGWFENGWGLSLIVFLPLVGALVRAGHSQGAGGDAEVDRHCVFAGVSFVLSVVLAFRFDFGSGRDASSGPTSTWITAINSRFHIGIDGISLPLVVLSTFITVLSIVYSWEHWPEPHNPEGLPDR